MKKEKLFEYKGELGLNEIEMLHNKIQEILLKNRVEAVIQKRIFAIMQEALENVFRYSKDLPVSYKKRSGFSFALRNNHFIIECKNVVDTASKIKLVENLKQLNSLNKQEIKSLYQKKVMRADISEHGGAGLGLITIAKVMMHKIYFAFAAINENAHMYNMKIMITNNTISQHGTN